ncbi:MAG: MBL fold metallo-hydrolase [Myxococcota bacterium]
MRFVLLGTGTTLPDGDRGPAGFLVEDGDARVLVDGGSGTIQRLARHGVDARRLDGGVYTHRHVDHCGDLVPLLFTMRVGIDVPRHRDYPIWAGEGFVAYFAQLAALYPGWLTTDRYGVPITELPLDGPGAAVLPGGTRLDTLPAKHSQGALHLGFTGTDGFRVVFSGDTGYSDNLAKLARGADVLVTECGVSRPDPWMSHLTPEDVTAIVDAARPKRVVLTHLYPDVDPDGALRRVRSTGIPVERGFDGQVLTP